MITINVQTKDKPFIKKAKAQGHSSRIYVPKRYGGKTITLIPVHYRVLEEDIEFDGEYYSITINSNYILQKTLKPKDKTLQVFLPAELTGVNFLIFESEDINYR